MTRKIHEILGVNIPEYEIKKKITDFLSNKVDGKYFFLTSLNKIKFSPESYELFESSTNCEHNIFSTFTLLVHKETSQSEKRTGFLRFMKKFLVPKFEELLSSNETPWGVNIKNIFPITSEISGCAFINREIKKRLPKELYEKKRQDFLKILEGFDELYLFYETLSSEDLKKTDEVLEEMEQNCLPIIESYLKELDISQREFKEKYGKELEEYFLEVVDSELEKVGGSERIINRINGDEWKGLKIRINSVLSNKIEKILELKMRQEVDSVVPVTVKAEEIQRLEIKIKNLEENLEREVEKKLKLKEKSINILEKDLRKVEEINSQFFINYKRENEILSSQLDDSVLEVISLFSTRLLSQFELIYEEYQKLCSRLQHSLKKEWKVTREMEELIEEAKLDSFNNYLTNLAEMEDEGWKNQIVELQKKIEEREKEIEDIKKFWREDRKKIDRFVINKVRAEKYHKKFHKHKKANQLQHQLNQNILRQMTENQSIIDNHRAEIERKKRGQALLIKRALELSNEKTQLQQELTQKNQNYLNLGNQLLESKTQNQHQAQTITDLEAQIKTLQELANEELKSQTRQNTKLQGEKEDLKDEKKDLEEILKKAGLGLNEWRLKNKKLTTAQKVGALLVEKLRTDLTHLKSQSQTEINRLKQDKHHLQEELDLRKQTKKDLLAKNRELKKQQKEQAAKTTKQETTIQQLETEKTNWTQEKESWQKREQQLLAEIELLKNPPLTNANKENLKQTVIVKEIIREVIVKDLINEELGLKLTLQEKTKLNELPLQEAQNYRNQLIKNRFNQESEALRLYRVKTERERAKPWIPTTSWNLEREKSSSECWW